MGTYPQASLYKLHERRAKIYFEMNNYEEASSDYLKASSLIEDPLKASEMIFLSEKCLQSSTNSMNQKEKLEENGHQELPFLPNELYSGFSKKVNIRYEESRGRFGVAAADIEIGEIIGSEEPVVSRLKKTHELNHCHFCLGYLEDSCFLPCLNCVEAKYCSLSCRSKALEGYHKYECGLSTFLEDTLVKMKSKRSDIEDYYRLGFRAISQRPMEYFREIYKDLIHSNSNCLYNSEFLQGEYKSLSCLVDNYRNDVKANLWSQISACFIIRSLREKGYFGDLNSKKIKSKVLSNDERIVANLSRYFLEILKFNTHGIIECLSYKDKSSRVFANGIFANLALLNHSCAPNITKYFMGNKVYVVASTPIPKGSEISENYFPYWPFMEKDHRMGWLREHYRFECCCLACSRNYPLLSEMKNLSFHTYSCSECKGSVETSRNSRDEIHCSQCGWKYLKQNLKNDVVGLMDELYHRFESKSPPIKLLEVGKALLSKIQEPDPFLVEFQKIYGFCLRYAHGNKI